MMVHLIPGDPARRIAGLNASPQYVAEIRQSLGLDRPFLAQYSTYIRGVAHLDFGQSFLTGESVTEIIADRLRHTAELATVAFLLVITLSLSLGIGVAAFTQDNRHSRAELAFTAVAAVGGAVPEFLAATVLAFIFAVWLRLLPVAGIEGWTSVILPAAAISIRPTAILSRIVRVETLNVLAQDYIRTARSKRLPGRLLYLRHVLPNVLTSALTLGGLLFSSLLAGAVIVENVFAWPGLGVELVRAVQQRDYPVIQGIVLMLGIAVAAVNLLVDSILRVVDPRSVLRAQRG
jgi:peptide/nickel transport system permease protein